MKTAQPGQREELLDAIAREEARVARLDSEQVDARNRLAALRAEAPLGYAEPADEVTVERDEDVLRSLKELDDFA